MKELKILFFLTICLTAYNCNPPNKKSPSLVESTLLQKSCIDYVIAIDDSIGKIRNHNCKTLSLSETIQIYTAEIDKIDFKNCPPEFAKAFNDHKEAWTKITSITDKYPDLRGEMHDLFKNLEEGKDKDTFEPLLDSMWSTWAEVEGASKR